MEGVKTGTDGYIFEVIISYKDTSDDSTQDWFHRTVERPVRNVIKLFNIDDTSLLDEITQVYQMAEEYLKSDEARLISKQPNQSKKEIKFDAEGKLYIFWTALISFKTQDLLSQDVLSPQIIEKDPSSDLFVEDLIKNYLDFTADPNVYLI